MEVNIFSDPRYTLKWKLIYSQISDILQMEVNLFSDENRSLGMEDRLIPECIPI